MVCKEGYAVSKVLFLEINKIMFMGNRNDLVHSQCIYKIDMKLYNGVI